MPDPIIEIALADLYESPTNPRKTFTDIESLAADIRSVGRIVQPLLVRPRAGRDDYEIVFGHRRARAAEVAGLATAPCMVRAMTDAEAARVQISENLQRVDVHPIEEAEGFAALLMYGATREALAEQIGKSLSYVTGRLALLRAVPEVREACLAGKITSEAALLLARLRTPALQAKALQAIGAKGLALQDGGQVSYRRIRDLLREQFVLEFEEAIFDPADATLLPEAGACHTCPKRTGNAPEFADLAADGESRHRMGKLGRARGIPDSCTDPDCWAAKRTAHLKRAAAELAAKGHTVIDGAKARAAISATGQVKGAYISAAELRGALPGKAKAAAPQVTIQDPRTGRTVTAYKVADLQAAGLTTADAIAAKRRAPGGLSAEQRTAQTEAAKAAAAEAHALMLHRLQVLRQALAQRERTAFDLAMVTRAALQGLDWHASRLMAALHPVPDGDDDGNRMAAVRALLGKLDTMSPAELSGILMDCLLCSDLRNDLYTADGDATPPTGALALADHHGIELPDTLLPAAQPDPAPPAATPSTAALGADEAAALRRRGVRYRDPATGATWTGKGLQPAWLRAALAAGATLAALELPAAPTPSTAGAATPEAPAKAARKPAKRAPAGAKGKGKATKQNDDAGDAGERCPRTRDMLDEAPAS